MKITGTDLAAILPPILWFILGVVVIVVFKDILRDLLRTTLWRVKTGAPIKIASFELGASYVSTQTTSAEKGGLLEVREDPKNIRYEERKQYYEPTRRIFLVHRIAPSKDPHQLYDIAIYLLPHEDNSLIAVHKVEYYFGRSWGNRIFTSIDRANNFLISTSAFGPFVCTAEVHFSDGTAVMLWRYIDFEMGAIGKEAPKQ